MRGGTRLKMVFNYDYSVPLVGKVLNLVLVERLLKDNMNSYIEHVRELSELTPLPMD